MLFTERSGHYPAVRERTLQPTDLERLQAEYRRRAARLAGSDRYALTNPAHLFTVQQRQRAVAHLLRRERLLPLHEKRILELGCGRGDILQELLAFGANPALLFGMDVLPERVTTAVDLLPHLPLSVANGMQLPYPDAAFDVVLQYTVFSSILDTAVQQQIASEMRRVLRPGGVILWYDFWLNPTNRQTRGLRATAVRELFPGCVLTFDRITLAPPLTRKIVPLTWLGAGLLEKLRLLNTHYLVAIRPPA